MTKALDSEEDREICVDPLAVWTIDLEAEATENSKRMWSKMMTKGTVPAAGEQKKPRRWRGRGGLSRGKVRTRERCPDGQG